MSTMIMATSQVQSSSGPAADYRRRLKARVELGSFARGDDDESLSADALALVPGADLESAGVRTALRRWALVFARALQEFALLSDEVVEQWDGLSATDLVKIDDAIRAVDDGLKAWMRRA